MNRGPPCRPKPKNDYNFIYEVIQDFRKLLQVVPFGNFGGSLYSTLEFSGKAVRTEEVLLGMEGVILYLYIKAYQQPFPKNPTQMHINQLFEIYDALKLPRPVIRG